MMENSDERLVKDGWIVCLHALQNLLWADEFLSHDVRIRCHLDHRKQGEGKQKALDNIEDLRGEVG